MKAIKVSITGKVQGVYYRASTKDYAYRNGITGFCKNELDGSVTVYAEGRKIQLEGLVEWCRKGSKMARVQEVLVEEVEIQHLEKFEIRR
jgi:acylphosphatase